MKCKHPHCRKRAQKGSGECYRCEKRMWRKNNPISAQYSRLKESARKRGIEFTITREEFAEFARQTDFHNQTGNFAHSLTVDRINPDLGYTPGNIQPLTRLENMRKQLREQEERFHAGHAWQRK